MYWSILISCIYKLKIILFNLVFRSFTCNFGNNFTSQCNTKSSPGHNVSSRYISASFFQSNWNTIHYRNRDWDLFLVPSQWLRNKTVGHCFVRELMFIRSYTIATSWVIKFLEIFTCSKAEVHALSELSKHSDWSSKEINYLQRCLFLQIYLPLQVFILVISSA